MNENLGTSKILIKTVVRNLKALASKSGLFNRTYCLEAVVDDATRTLNSAIEFIDAGDAQLPTNECLNTSPCFCKCCHCIRQQDAEEQRRMAAIGHQLEDNLLVLYDFFDKLKSKPPYRGVPYKVAMAVNNMSKLALRLDNTEQK